MENTAASLVCIVSRLDHISPVLFRLCWVPVQFRIRFKVQVITLKAIHGVVPEYINDLIGIKSISRYSLRSSEREK